MTEKISAEQLRNPDYTPPLHIAIPPGIQHVLAMFVSNLKFPRNHSHLSLICR